MDMVEFCRDGILRVHPKAWDPDERAHKGRRVSLQAWQEAVDSRAFLKSLRSPIRFEPGLTVLELFENLAPWADLMSSIACMDFPAYLAEARRAPSGQDMSQLSHIDVFWRSIISPVADFTPPTERFSKDDKGRREFNVGKPKKTGRIEADCGWDMSVMLTEAGRAEYDGQSSVSLSFCPISDWAHLELRLLEEGLLFDETIAKSSQDFLGTQIPLINAQHPLVTARPQTNSNAQVMACDPPAPAFFETLVCGVMWEIGFDYSPVQRDARYEDLKDRVEQVRSAEAEGAFKDPDPDLISDYDRKERARFLEDMRQIEAAEVVAERLGIGARRLN
jgi:hypothetical protein